VVRHLSFSIVGGLTGCGPFSFMLCGVLRVQPFLVHYCVRLSLSKLLLWGTVTFVFDFDLPM
jgi:hypothetical protein